MINRHILKYLYLNFRKYIIIVLHLNMANIKVNNFNIKLLTIDPDLAKEYPEYDSSMCPAKISFDILGINTSIANSIRRVVLDEIPNYALNTTSPYNCITITKDTDTKIIDDFITIKIRSIPIRYNINTEYINAIWELNVINETSEPKNIFSGDLIIKNTKLPNNIFHKNILLCQLQPFKSLHIDNIKLENDIGRNNASFQVIKRSMSIPIDLEEYPLEETHLLGGSQVDYSGYKESNLVSDPKQFRLSGILNTVNTNNNSQTIDTIKLIYINACKNIIERLNIILHSIKNNDNANIILKTEKKLDSIYGCLKMFEENQTIGLLIHRFIFDTYPNESTDNQVAVIWNYKQHEYLMEVPLKATLNFEKTGGIQDIINISILNGIKKFNNIIKALESSKPKIN